MANKRGPKPRPAAMPSATVQERGDPGPEPSCPEFLDDGARREWRRVLPSLRTSGSITRVDRAALAAYCDAYSQFKQASRELSAWIKAHGTALIKTPQGPIKHPCLAIKRDAAAAMMKYAAEFGFSPASRRRMTPADRESKPKVDAPKTALSFVRFSGGRSATG